MSAELLEQARRGDEGAFAQLVEPHRRELEVHCYRMLGSLQDAEDALQETLLAAWQAIGTFEARSSVRTWLYRIATNRCLNLRRSASRRPQRVVAPPVDPPEPTHRGEVLWLEPYPDTLLEGLPDHAPGPEVRCELSESISLAFVTALQRLPPRQRAALVLRDVLGFPAREAATMLGTSEESVTSALKRARSSLPDGSPGAGTASDGAGLPAGRRVGMPGEADVVRRLARAWESGDVAGVVALLSDDARVTMPPMPFEYQGREAARRFLAAVAFPPGRTYLLVPTRANRQPAFAAYLGTPDGAAMPALGLLVVSVSGGMIDAITRFLPDVLGRFGLPLSIGTGTTAGAVPAEA